ncbi:MAG: RDD family protein [Candidatus Acidiferrales bacterium]
MFCHRCGTGMADDAGFCPSCGAPVQRNQPAPPPPPPPQNWQPQQQMQPQPQPPQGWPPPPQQVMVPQMPYAGFWKRFLAYLVDGVIVGAAFLVVLFVVFLIIGGGALLSGNESFDEFAGAMTGVAVLLLVLMYFGLIVAVWLYFAKSESSASQATIGKRAAGIYVTDLNGQRLTFGRATGRFFSKIITNLIPFGIGWIMAGFTEKKQALHDMIAGTLVLRRG